MKSGSLKQTNATSLIAAQIAVAESLEGLLDCSLSQLYCCPGLKRLGEQNSLPDLLRLVPSGKGRLLPEASLSMNR